MTMPGRICVAGIAIRITPHFWESRRPEERPITPLLRRGLEAPQKTRGSKDRQLILTWPSKIGKWGKACHSECRHRGPNRDRIFLRINPMNDPVRDFEPNTEYEESCRLGLGLTMLFIGLAAGALAALLLAPTTGKEMRRTLRRRYDDAREVMEDIGDHAGDWIDKGSEWADKAKSKMGPLKRPFGR
jgi:hypothetical protein